MVTTHYQIVTDSDVVLEPGPLTESQAEYWLCYYLNNDEDAYMQEIDSNDASTT